MYQILGKNAGQFKEYIEQQLGNKSELLDNIFKSLSETSSCIAGGSVLSFINNEKINDLDIYVPTKNIIKFMELINTGPQCNSLTIIDKNISSAYDQSFFKKNKIRYRYTFIINGENYDEDIYIYPNVITPPHTKIKVDIMLIDTNFENVVTNFDLNICEIFTNGESIYTTSKENYINIIEKNASLKKDYHKCYFEENRFILSRLKKYMLKDYEISINSSKINLKEILVLNENIRSDEKKQLKIKDKHIDDEEEFFVKKMIEQLFENCYIPIFVKINSRLYKNLLKYIKLGHIDIEEQIKQIKKITFSYRGNIYHQCSYRNKLSEIIFISLLEDFSLSSFRKLLVNHIGRIDGNIFYMILMDTMKKMRNTIKRTMIHKYNNWYFQYYIPLLWVNILIIHHDLSKLSKEEKIEKITDWRYEINNIYIKLTRKSRTINEEMIKEFSHIIRETFGLRPEQVSKVRQKATLVTNTKFIENRQHCNLVNPKMFDKHDKNREMQLLCFESSKLGNNAIEIIDKYLIQPFQDVVQYHYYIEDERLIHIKHNIEKPDEMSGIIDYNKEEQSYGLIDGETLKVSEALKTNYVFKVNQHYFHYSEDDLNELLNNKDLWMFECSDEKDEEGYMKTNYEELFIKLSLPNGVFTIGSEYLYSMFNEKQKVFEIIEQDRILKKTTSFKNTKIGGIMGISQFVSANHCQEGSDLKVYILKDNSNSDENSSLKPLFNNINSEELSENKNSENNNINSEPTSLKPLFNNFNGGGNTHLIKKKDKKKRSIKKKHKKQSIKKKDKKKYSNKKKTKRKY